MDDKRNGRAIALFARPSLFAKHVLRLGGASPLWAVMTGTTRLGQGVCREAESEGSRCRNSDSTHRNRIEGSARWVTRQWTRRPDGHSETCRVDPARPEGKPQNLTWEVSRPVRRPTLERRGRTIATATWRARPGEVSRGRSSSLHRGTFGRMAKRSAYWRAKGRIC